MRFNQNNDLGSDIAEVFYHCLISALSSVQSHLAPNSRPTKPLVSILIATNGMLIRRTSWSKLEDVPAKALKIPNQHTLCCFLPNVTSS